MAVVAILLAVASLVVVVGMAGWVVAGGLNVVLVLGFSMGIGAIFMRLNRLFQCQGRSMDDSSEARV